MNSQEFSLNHIVATDVFGRTLPEVSSYKEGKYVGLFYFLWHGQHEADKTRDITQLLKTNYQDIFAQSENHEDVIPYWSWLHWNEPLYGYYSSTDEWVMRKHLEMFIASRIDFLVMDFTNGIYYPEPLRLLMDLLLEYREAGWKVPQVSFYINVKPQEITRKVYEDFYLNPKYEGLFFYGNYDKPLMISVPGELDDEMNAYFHVRVSQWLRPDYPETIFPYWDITRDWHVYTDMVSVSLAQCGTAFSFYYEPWDNRKHEAWGRGYTSKTKQNGDIQAILRGDNCQEGWDAAIALDPDIVFLTGWNEWVVNKVNFQETFPTWIDHEFPYYTDNFTTEFSRDIEMTKAPTYVLAEDGSYIEEGLGDNCFLQMMQNVRRFKGIAGTAAQDSKQVARYEAIATKKIARDAKGFYEDCAYTQQAPDNFVRAVEVSCDADQLYFSIETARAVSAYETGKTNWMNLLIGIEGTDLPAWEHFHFVVNRQPQSETVTSLERFGEAGAYTPVSAGEISYRVQDNRLTFAIPRTALGIQAGSFSLIFKVTDGIEEPDNMMDYYVSGEAFPLGRMAYRFQG